MDILFQTGVLLITGFLLGELAVKAKLPKISGYIIAGIVLHPQITGFIQPGFTKGTEPLINVALTFITFSIGGSLSFLKIRETGKTILLITLFESLFAYLSVFIMMLLILHFFFPRFESWSMVAVVSLVLGSLAAPTDPSATLAVTQEYKAKGAVSTTVMSVAAFDDIMGILFYTLSLSIAGVILGTAGTSVGSSLIEMGREIFGAIGVGIFFGFVFNKFSIMFQKETEGALIVIILTSLLLCYGTSSMLGFDELLGTMTMGMIVVNFHKRQEQIFGIIERYTDELIFVLFFTLSGLHLRFDTITGSLIFIGFFVISRALGKYAGTYLASTLTHAPDNVRKYTAGGLFPQGGIVIGLALLLAKKESLSDVSSFIISIVIGAAIIHELFGPILARMALKKAGEIK